jgi:fused signal recognition particle receptor
MSVTWKQGLGKTRKGFFGRIKQLFSGASQMTDDLFDNMEEMLIESDMGVDTANDLIEKAKAIRWEGSAALDTQIRQFLKKELLNYFDQPEKIRNDSFEKPQVILVVGVNGTGKTTTIGKLAGMYREKGLKVILAGADTFRAAAGEQLEIWGKRCGADVIRQPTGADPASVAYDALDAAIARDADVLLVDTAGRLQNKANLMEELKKIRRVIKKRMDSAPHEVILVLDATIGQNAVSQAKVFTEAAGVTQIALTKLDGTAKGGVVIAIQRKLGIPVRWAGLGEGIDDIKPFDPEAFIHAVLDAEE